ncbi:f-box domain protein [Rutstroemia sp. NJR-2017a WRK4]|nr:f-box domain protein [Rutstroemia sp. NJR-2017a WRK4]PQE11812.1 f-box domain protein [Rutstroemia sp. NJR-2017a WRK4]
MSLTGLPNELLHKIIPHTLPEGFEGLALTCKRFYALCTPFIETHNKLRSRFHNFTYFDEFNDPRGAVSIKTAWDLIIRIAIEPVVARYIRNADFRRDSIPVRTRPHPRRGEAVMRLLGDSPHLEQAGLSWKAFHAEIEEKLEEKRYSQSAAAFLLTLLPNVKKLTLPSYWKADVTTSKLLYTIVVEATQPHQPPWNERSLAQVTRFEISASWNLGDRDALHNSIPFLYLPHLRSFEFYSCIAMGDALLNIEPQYLYRDYGRALETVDLSCCHIDDAALASFLKHTPRLKTLKYSHRTKEDTDPSEWDICKFVTAIERETGNHLEQLSISIRELHGSLPLGKVSMRGFQRLRRLELPLDIAMCDIRLACSEDDQTTEYSQLSIGDLVPASVSQLSLFSRGKDHHEKALDVLFRNFSAKKHSQVPALREIRLSCPENPAADDAYKEQCAKLASEMQKVNMALVLDWRVDPFHPLF